MGEQAEFSVRFWGVRGSIACPGEKYQRYGGNTSCLEVRCGGEVLIFDAGTGLMRLGEHLACAEQLRSNLFLTHTHFDHINGLPFFAPLFCPKNRLRLWAGHLQPELTLHEALGQFMAAPLFPVPPEVFAANVSFHDFTAGETLEPHPGIKLRTAPLNHPNKATGYRIDHGGSSLCYITDTEHVEGTPDENILALVDRADVMIYDSTYTEDEFPNHRCWGHSTWHEGARLCDMASVKQLVIFHHDPGHDDDFMDQVAAAAERQRPGSV
ncbi:MAG: MBL fold metallo-hydrolase, partial [Rhodospirillales bacterium]|nr:MBL fold metallo-hydrolase [Rhodospirillales bacterium]